MEKENNEKKKEKRKKGRKEEKEKENWLKIEINRNLGTHCYHFQETKSQN